MNWLAKLFDKMLCGMRMHRWSHPGGHCLSCGKRDDFFDKEES